MAVECVRENAVEQAVFLSDFRWELVVAPPKVPECCVGESVWDGPRGPSIVRTGQVGQSSILSCD